MEPQHRPGVLRLAHFRLWGPGLALIVLCVGFGLAEPRFASVENLWAIADRSAIPLILAVGMTFVVLQGSIDLSIEGGMATCSLTLAMLVLNSRSGLDLGLLGVVLALLPGVAIGLLNGIVVTRLGVPSFMATLGTWSAALGAAMLLSGGQPPLIHDQALRAFGLGRTWAVPNLVLVAILVLALGYVLQNYTRFGRYSMAIGGGEALARLSGLAVDRYKVAAFAFSGFLAGLGGVLGSMQIGLGHVDIGVAGPLGQIRPDRNGQFVGLVLAADSFLQHGSDVTGHASGKARMRLLVAHVDIDKLQFHSAPDGAPARRLVRHGSQGVNAAGTPGFSPQPVMPPVTIGSTKPLRGG